MCDERRPGPQSRSRLSGLDVQQEAQVAVVAAGTHRAGGAPGTIPSPEICTDSRYLRPRLPKHAPSRSSSAGSTGEEQGLRRGRGSGPQVCALSSRARWQVPGLSLPYEGPVLKRHTRDLTHVDRSVSRHISAAGEGVRAS